ncbi:tigger transposable element-derived protein 7-like isoform X4 [Scylla paramamosain]|uniref:tigger transposable element-derived protein 7-like isoform X4 n=1 Tax=Scylla paramamosain TaxID=85552 RepID=UPI003082E516
MVGTPHPCVLCRRAKHTHPQCVFHRFPKEGERSITWQNVVKSPHIEGKTVEQLHRSYKVCSLNFSPRNYVSGLPTSRLRSDACPDQNLESNQGPPPAVAQPPPPAVAEALLAAVAQPPPPAVAQPPPPAVAQPPPPAVAQPPPPAVAEALPAAVAQSSSSPQPDNIAAAPNKDTMLTIKSGKMPCLHRQAKVHCSRLKMKNSALQKEKLVVHRMDQIPETNIKEEVEPSLTVPESFVDLWQYEGESREQAQFMQEVKEEFEIKIEDEFLALPDEPFIPSQQEPSGKQDTSKTSCGSGGRGVSEGGMASYPSSACTPKRKNLSLAQKMEVIADSEKGMSRMQLMERYGLKKTTLHDILKAKDKVREAVRQMDCVSKGAAKVFRTRKLPQENLEEAVYKWYAQQRAEGVPVRGVDIQHAALRLADHLGLTDFKCSDGWLKRFRKRHGICNRAITGELLSADLGAVEPFVQKVAHLIEEECLHTFQVYNADETSLFWHSLPKNIQAAKDFSSTPGYKTMKERLSILVGANADGSHHLQPVIVGKSKNPRMLKDLMNKLPVEYHASKSAWFTQDIFEEWFHKSFTPAVRKHQSQYGISAEHVKAVLLLDNAPAYPVSSKLCTKDGRVKVMFLPPNTTSALQPMDHGVIESAKRHYKKLFMQQCLVVIEDGMGEEGYDDNRGKKTREHFKNYNIKDAIFNWAEAWKKVPLNTLRNAWCTMLKAPKIQAGENDFEGFDVGAMAQMLDAAGQGTIAEEELNEWLEEDGGLPGYHHQTEEEIANEVLQAATPSPTPEDDDEEEEETSRPSLAAVIEATDMILRHINSVGGSLARHYEVIRLIRMEMMQEQQGKKIQPKISSFFKAVPSPADKRRRISVSSDASVSSLTSAASTASLHIESEPSTSCSVSPVISSSGLVILDTDLAENLDSQ